jgi:hypothetical protein
MAYTPDLGPTIGTNAAAPKRVKTEAGEIEQLPIADQIAADRYLALKVAGTKKHRGIRFSRFVPGSAVGKTPGNTSGDTGEG